VEVGLLRSRAARGGLVNVLLFRAQELPRQGPDRPTIPFPTAPVPGSRRATEGVKPLAAIFP
jgi:hypothetical protein